MNLLPARIDGAQAIVAGTSVPLDGLYAPAQGQIGIRPDAVRLAYNRAEYMDERRNLMQSWADYLDGLRNETA